MKALQNNGNKAQMGGTDAHLGTRNGVDGGVGCSSETESTAGAAGGDAQMRLRPPDVGDEFLVYESRDFAIWVCPTSLDVMWKTATGFNDKFEELRKCKEWGEVMARQTELEAFPMHGLPKYAKLGFRFQVGVALLFLFIANFDQAKKSMVSAENFYRSKIAEKARGWILRAGLVTLIVPTLLATISGWLPAVINGLPNESFDRLMLAGFAGIWGTFISLVSRASALGIDATAGQIMHYLEAVCRVLTGMVAGSLLISALAAKVVAPSLLDLGSPAILLLGFAAGFSERLLPSLVGKVESSVTASAAPHRA